MIGLVLLYRSLPVSLSLQIKTTTWYKIEQKTIFPYSILAIFFPFISFQTENLPIQTKIFFHNPFLLLYKGALRPETKSNLYCTLEALTISLLVVTLEGMQTTR